MEESTRTGGGGSAYKNCHKKKEYFVGLQITLNC